jgi:multidrug efflux pump subunit AcrB
MWIVKVALERPYTFIVLALLLLIFGPLAILRMPKDIFPNIGIPVVSVVWGYTGLGPQDMADRIVAQFERALTTRSTISSISNRNRFSAPGSSRSSSSLASTSTWR